MDATGIKPKRKVVIEMKPCGFSRYFGKDKDTPLFLKVIITVLLITVIVGYLMVCEKW